MYIRNYRTNSGESAIPDNKIPPEKTPPPDGYSGTSVSFNTQTNKQSDQPSNQDITAQTSVKRVKLKRTRTLRFANPHSQIPTAEQFTSSQTSSDHTYATPEFAERNNLVSPDTSSKNSNFLHNFASNIKLDDAVIGSLMLLFLNQNSDDIMILAFAYLFYVGLLS